MLNINNSDYFDDLNILTGVVRYHDLAYLLTTQQDLSSEKIPNTIYIEIDQSDLGSDILNWNACSIAVCKIPLEQAILLGETGYISVYGSKHEEHELSIFSSLKQPSRGPMREIRGIAKGYAYAVGTHRQAYKRINANQWICIDQTAQDNSIDMTEKSFESIDGFSEEDIYTVGWDGEIWHFDGNTWTQKDSPTNLALYKVKCAEDGFVYACGQVGTLLKGRDNQWEIIEQDITSEDFWGVEYFNQKAYFSTLTGIYEFHSNSLKKVNYGETLPPFSCYHLSAADGILWSIGARNVYEFDGQQWTILLSL